MKFQESAGAVHLTRPLYWWLRHPEVSMLAEVRALPAEIVFAGPATLGHEV